MKVYVDERVDITEHHELGDISAIFSKACCLYFKNAYVKYQKNITQNTLMITPFHLALTDKGDNELIDLVKKEINDEKVLEFVLNASTSDYISDQVADQEDDGMYLPKHLQFVKLILNEMNQKEKMLICEHSKPQYDVNNTDGTESVCENITKKHEFDCTFELPLALCTFSGQLSRYKSLVHHGANIFSTDKNGNNIIHSLVVLSENNPQNALDFFRLTMGLCHSSSEKNILLLSRNFAGVQPLELAAKMCLPELFREIFLTDNVYRFISKECISHQHVLYDVSEYEKVNSKRHNPLSDLISMTDDDVSRADACDFFKFAPLRKWMENRMRRSNLDLTLFALFWIIFYLLTVSQQILYAQTGEYFLGLEIAMMTFASNVILTEAVLIVLHLQSVKRFLKNLVKAKFPAAFTTGYRIFQSAFCWNIILGGAIRLSGIACRHLYLIQFLHIHASTCGVVSILFFAQLVTSLGHIMMMLQRMIYDTMVFLQIGFVVFFAPAMTMYLLHNGPTCWQNNNTDIYHIKNDSNVFTTLPKSMYEMFLHMMSIIPPNPLYFTEAIVPEIAQFVYISTVLMGSVLLLNLLIGIMGQRVTEITNHKDTLLLLEQLSISILAGEQKSFSLIVGNVLGKWFHRWNRRHFRHNADLSKVYVEVIEPRNIASKSSKSCIV